MARYDKDGVVIAISNALCRKLGGVKHDFVGRNCNFFVLHNEREELLSEISKSILTGMSWKGEFRRYTEKGEVLWLASTIFPVTNGRTDQGNEYHNILEDITHHKLLEEVSVTDTLTSLYNRRKFDEILDHEFKLARRRNVSLALAIIDVDYFKKYNDHYGHPGGDKVLEQTALSIRSSLSRPDDYAFRLGGEEFAIIFSDLGKEAALEMLDKIRINIEQLRIEHSPDCVSKYLTISIGAKVSIPDELSDKNAWYSEADNLLYNAKQKRNAVIVG
ncbi:MAG: sensor domain-containing diguanylate cyclase [Gammaproteobacteria bacterium]|nr:sensor domain-containing diguanylate cyclase [Gammaproteobacteria bacterium]